MGFNVESVYEGADADPDFASVLHCCAPTAATDDDALAELIEADGRWRLRKGRPVTLDRYLAAIPGLAERSNVLDAALEVTLRGMSGSSRVSSRAADDLASRYPPLRNAIREAAALNAALWSTTGLRERLSPRPVLPLPSDFGAPLPSGQPRYILRELLGQGSFGQVYRAEDRQLSEEGHPAIVAIKILSSADRSEHDRHRMIEEATKARRISHPNVVQVLDRGTSDDGEDYIVYEFVGGGDLADAIATSLPLEPARAAALVADIARGLHAAHAAGVIHCDLKPSNVMLTPDGRPKIADFGIAVRVGEDRRAELAAQAYGRGPVGNIAFISPEQFLNDDRGFSVPSDVYALGGMLYHLLTGALPNGSSREEIARAHEAANTRTAAPSARAMNPRVDADLDAIVRRALSTNPEDRHASAIAFAEDLDRWRNHEPINWRQPSFAKRTMLWARRKPGLAATSALVLIVGFAGLFAAMYFSREADRRAAEADRKTLEAQIAQMKVDDAARDAALKEALKSLLGLKLPELKRDRRFLTDMLMQVWVYEFIYGPKALGDPASARQMWSIRVPAIRDMLHERESAGAGDTMESTLWRYALAFWLVSDHDYHEALPLIDRVEKTWKRMLEPDDPWLGDLGLLRLCAEVNRACDPAADLAAAPDRSEILAAFEQRLLAGAEHMAATYPRSPLHYLVLNRRADLYGPNGMNRPAEAESLLQSIQALIDDTQNKNLGVADALSSRREKPATQPATQPSSQP